MTVAPAPAPDPSSQDDDDADDGLFARTRWSLIRLAIDEGNPDAKDALNDLGLLYYEPIRKCVHTWLAFHAQDTERTDDLSNGFFHKLLRLNKLAAADPQRGKFRNYLRCQLQGFLHDQVNRFDHAQKRDVRRTVSHDATDADGQALVQLVDGHSPLDEFDREFTRTLIANTMARLRQRYERKGKSAVFDALAPHITAEDDSGLKPLAVSLGVSYEALRNESKRLRERWREAIWAAVAATLDDPTDENIRAELAELMGLRRAERHAVQHSAPPATA